MSIFTAKEQISVPPEVDTMREEICPVCGSDDSYVGDKCTVCGFEKPPSIFMDPDTSLAQNVNLRQDDQEDANDDGAGELQCPNCGETFPSAEALNAAGDPHLAPAAQTIPAEEDLEVPQGAEEQPEPTEGPPDNQMAPPPPEGAEGSPEDVEAEVPLQPGEEEEEPQPKDGAPPMPGEEEEEPEGPLPQPGEEEGAPEEEPPEQGQVEQVDPEAMAEEQYAADQQGMQQTGYEEGDICPNCGQGLLQPIGEGDAVPVPGEAPEVEGSDEMPQGGPRPFPPGAEGDDEPEPEEEEEEGPPSPVAEEEQEDEPDEEDADQDGGEEESEDGDQPPWLKKKKAVHMNYPNHRKEYISTMPNPPRRRATPRQATTQAQSPNQAFPAQTPRSSVRTALHASLNAQAGVLRRMTAACHQERMLRLAAEARISTLERQMYRFATLAGADADPELRGINEEGYRVHANLMARAASLHTADARDPAQPVPEGAPEPPIVTEQQAAEPAARTDVSQLGATPVTDVSADATVAVDEPYGTMAFEPMNLNEVDVTAPVQNTQGHLPPEQTIIPVEVRVGDPDDPQPSYGWTLDGGNPSGQTGGSVGSGQPTQGAPGSPPGVMPGTRASRNDGQVSLGALRLARLRMSAGIAPPNQDDLSIAASIQDNPDMTVEAVNTEIKTLTQVLNVQAPNGRVATANRRLVPRSAQGPSEAPSLAPTGEGPIRAHASTGAVTDDEILFE
jgi:hypothetical protein